jgi:redox-sensitive bicupin YhaK (pirin superfamily)
MLRYVDSAKMGRSRLDWLDSHFHFSFADYYNPDNIQFGALRVWNDDMVQPGTGFGKHGHQNMEIISYVIQGELTHGDSMGNRHTLTRGQVQYMSAGTGVVHSEMNLGRGLLRFFQIWILPDQDGYPPAYGDHRFLMEDRLGRWLPIATQAGNADSEAPIQVHADINAYAAVIEKGQTLGFNVAAGRQAYLVLAEGEAQVAGIHLKMRDAIEITEEDIVAEALEDAHMVIIEMGKGAAL